jgi:hypothetical protein
MPREPFPSVPFGEFTITRPFTAPGLFAYRYMQADKLLHFPDFSDGDMDAEQRKEALTRMVNVHRPLAAIVLFLGVVALEDFIRDLCARLADMPDLINFFPNISQLQPTLKKSPKPYARPDKDPASLSDWPEVNSLLLNVIGIEPIAVANLPKLHDLALIRHTVAHHAALVRPLDVSRFQYWEVQANMVINPPVEFVQQISKFLYEIGRNFEEDIKNQLFRKVIDSQPTNWHENPCDLIVTLIETFNWFGKLLNDNNFEPFLIPGSVGYEDEMQRRSAANKNKLTKLCIEELLKKYPLPPS